jgi:Rod binding domain-containing protein
MDTTSSLDAASTALRAPGLPGRAPGLEGAKKTAQDFEAFFVTSMLESMTQGIKTNKLFGGGQGETLYRSMLNQEYGKAIAAHGSLGIAAAVQREIIKMQQEAQK